YQWPNDLEQSLVFFAWSLLFGLLGGGLGMLFLGLRQRLQQLIARWKLAVLPQALGTGVVVALVNHWQPLALFSGEQQITALLQGKLLQGALPMLLLGLLKLLLAALCLSTGWVGGLFFPLIFGAAAMAQGLALALPGKRRVGSSAGADPGDGHGAQGPWVGGGASGQRDGLRGAQSAHKRRHHP
ncbi:MAG: hypothetical protein EBU30_12770, partial [Synechococcaceae bacterium WB6_3B_236]|nr:hypothetical protein [Synechococcaceae bacterium WB6_3B_236]